jgi:Leu/Phe-tRNA-protein transferase
MTLKQFIKDNRKELDEAIRRVCSNCALNDKERAEWVRNDEGLYQWARSCGVRSI